MATKQKEQEQPAKTGVLHIEVSRNAEDVTHYSVSIQDISPVQAFYALHSVASKVMEMADGRASVTEYKAKGEK